MKQLIYLDEGTTSWPKRQETIDALVEGAQVKGSAGRGNSREPDRLTVHARNIIAQHLGVSGASDIVLVPGATYGLNMVLKGFLKPGDTVLVSIAEHNAVLRPLAELAQQGVELVWMKSEANGCVDPAWIASYILEGNRVDAIVCQQASNVTGLLQPVDEICAIGNEHGIPVIVDGSQAGGHVPINLAEMNPSAWVCSGHKGFRGVKGVGIVYLRSDFAPQPLITGGTGFGDETVPELARPDSYECGTNPLPAIMALGAAMDSETTSIEEIFEREQELVRFFIEGISEIEDITILGGADFREHLPIVSVISHRYLPDELSFILKQKHGIETRPGVHCAPMLHKFLGTYERGGAVRFSFSHMTSREDLQAAIDALHAVCE